MANLKDLKAKIVSTKKTQQTTRAMKMVSAAKLRRAQENIVNARPYAKKLDQFIRKISNCAEVTHPLLNPQQKTGGKDLLVVFTSDRGLCGGFNNNISKYTNTYLKENSEKEQDIIFVGKKGADYFKRLNILGIDSILNLSKVINYSVAADVADRIMKSYLDGEYAEVHIIYNEFKSAISQEVVDEKILPIELSVDDVEEVNTDFKFEPEAKEILDDLLTKHFRIQIYRCMQESVASEHGARMSAMENATNNAGDMIQSLTLTYNKIRQAKITTELIEITSGAEAL